jgi:hypothetical protein
METIEINGNKLHEIGLYQRSHVPGVVVTMRYPINKIKFSFEESNFYVEIPSLLAVELYRGAIIPQKSEVPFIIKKSGRSMGAFFVKKIIYPSYANDGVRFELERTNE